MERVPEDEVVRHWLSVERETAAAGPSLAPGSEAAGGDPADVAGLDGAAALDELLRHKPGAAAFIWRDAPVDWYRVELAAGEFLGLHVVAGPSGLYWRELSPEDTVRGAAERIRRGEADDLAAETGVDVAKVLALRDGMPGAADRALVLSTRRGCVPWTVADGNYRAVAKALYVLGGGDYSPQPAYLGVGANPVSTPLRERVCGRLRRVLSPRSGPARPP